MPFRRRKADTLTLDPTLGNDTAKRALGAAGDWEMLASILKPVTNPDERELAVTVVAEQTGWPRWVDEWVEARPKDPVGWTVRGAKNVFFGWEARGGSTKVDDKAWLTFQHHLEEAEDDLQRALKLGNKDPTPHVYRLVAARGLELPLDEVFSRFESVVALAPDHRFAHNQMIQSLAPKWGGSNDAMFDFAHTRTASAPEGSGLHALIAEAHIERWLGEIIAGDSAAAERYWTRPNVQEELAAAAERSILSPAYHRPARAAWDLQFFAFAFWRTGQHDLGRRAFELNGDVASETPWAYVGNPGAAFLRAKADMSTLSG